MLPTTLLRTTREKGAAERAAIIILAHYEDDVRVLLTQQGVTWLEARPSLDQPTHATIAINDPADGKLIDGLTLAKEIRRIVAETGDVTSIKDPTAWQREQRTDRPMPGREP